MTPFERLKAAHPDRVFRLAPGYEVKLPERSCGLCDLAATHPTAIYCKAHDTRSRRMEALVRVEDPERPELYYIKNQTDETVVADCAGFIVADTRPREGR